MKKMSLSLPLLFSMGGTVFSLINKKSTHKYWGVIYTCFALWHVYQHRNNIYNGFCELMGEEKVGIFSAFLPKQDLRSIVKKAKVSSYIPGRIRIYSSQLVNNSYAAGIVENIISGYKEIDSVKANVVTGSVLIEYRPEILRRNRELADLETYIQSKIRG